MPRAINRKDFLRLSSVGLAGAALVGAANCSRSLSGNQVVKFQTNAEETTNQEMQTTLQSEDPPDIVSYDTGPGLGGVLADAGLLLPLEDAYLQRGWDIYEWAKQRATY